MSEQPDDDDAAMRELLDRELVEAGLTEVRAEQPAAAAASTPRQFEDAIAAIASAVLKIPPDELDVRQNMARYGVDSIIVTEIMKRISDLIGQPIAPTVFFEAKHLAELAHILHTRYAKKVEVPSDAARWIARFRKVVASGTKIPLVQPAMAPAEARPSYAPVAIIAMEGMFAESADLQAFEKHLRAGDDCIGEVPADRWDWRAVYGDPKQGELTNVKYGGFAPDIDKFDPQFFGMSPREAELTDPQHRLFIQCVWKLIESAGYAPRSLAGRKIGIFLGINLQDYAHLIDRAGAMEAMHLTSLGHMFCPNRLSFYLDTHGPSQVIDTACSSSLVALHRAVLAVQHEGCEMAIAGGANLMISSDMHVMYSKVGMICEDGRCKTFSREANGYARGDGIGAVLVKPLAQAERDGDTILAVIRGSAENHGGASTSLTAPNPKAQASLIVEAHGKAGSDPRSVGYIECHGTGTALGDPIEVNGLMMAFETLYRAAGLEPSSAHCGLGSVKSNIGHAETAAGIAGVIKTVLSLRHGRLYPTLHCDDINPMIELERSPFYILQKGREWPHPVVDGEVLPRRAGVSSFGAGGSNAHVVIEEYVAPPPAAARAPSPSLIPLSAQNAARLDELLKDLLRFLEETPEAERLDIADIAYTLQVGRDTMAERLAVVTDSTTGLLAKLRQLVQGGAVANCYRGTVKRGRQVGHAASSRDLRRLAEAWTKGGEIDWQALHAGKPRRVSLPTYPFARQRYWLPQAVVAQHPLIHRDTSDASEQRFTSVFTGAEFFLADHIVSGEKVLPGVAYLEMARAAVNRAGLRLKNVVWARPYAVGAAPLPLHIGLAAPQDGQVAYRIYSDAGLHGQGTAVLEDPVPSRIDLEALRRTITNSIDVSKCYDSFAAMGIVYGPGHRCLDTVHFSTGSQPQVLARLELHDSAAPYVLHPGLIDSALQACVGLVGGQDRELPAAASLPFALDSFELVAKPPSTLWAWIRTAEGSVPNDRLRKLDIDLADDDGQVCIRLRGFSSRTPDASALVGHEPVWVVRPAAQSAPAWYKRSVVLCDLEGAFGKVAETPGIAWSRLPLSGAMESWYADAAIGVFDTIKALHAEQGAGRTLVQVVVLCRGDGALLGGLSGLVKTANRESTRVFAQLVEVAAADDLAAMLDAESRGIDDHVRYDGGRRHVMAWQEREPGASSLPWKEDGVYLITGGSGGLGQVFARHIAKQAPTAKIILCGRRQQVDVGRRDQVDTFIADVVRAHGRIDGVLHCAGLLSDNYIARKSAAEFAAVLAPKVAGALHLDAATADLDLDFFALFSSAAGALGSAGQADYAAANAFLDAFAHRRNAQVGAGSRHGHTVSIDWPLWAEGGMRMEPAAERMMRQTTGMEALPSDLGVRAFEEILASGVPQALVLYGSPARLRRSVAAPDVVAARTEEPRPAGTAERRGKIEQMLLGAVASLMKFELADLDVETEWSQYGFDSISLTEFSNKLNQQHRLELTPTIFFEYPTIGVLAAWLADNSDLFPASPATAPPPPVAQPRLVQPSASAAAPVQRDVEVADAVAIIGMSGRFPMARDIEEFWTNLQAGRDCIGEIPSDRNWQALGDEPRWGGFIDGIGNFDARFFGISPREAEQMDPQQRLLMEYAWKAIEDAGYAPSSLSGSNTALFVGTASSGYGNLILQSGAAIEGYSSTAVVGSIGPNRMSYFLNLHGPSEPIETACSSSLVAIHRALSAMAAGDCDQAIVGGINLILSPETHTSFAKAGMLCPDGRCKTFSRHANGYVRGEGVGMLFLKKLRAAERDGDHIYGVIRGSAENHGGRANSLTAPNPKAQAELLKRAYSRAGIDPRTVGYIEAHGTGTELGDPIEVNGLKSAFRDLYLSTGGAEVEGAHCGVGSVKSNIGHLELAAGVAGVIKVLLQLRHRTLVPTLHCDEVNPYIQLQGSPFYLVRETCEWTAPRDRNGRELPRRAGVSSFGFGGVNAHVVIEEYAPRREVSAEWPSPGLVVLSARTAERLKESAAALLAFVEEGVRPAHDDALVDRVRELTAEILRVDTGEIDASRPLDEYGVDVLQRSMLGARLEEAFGVEIDAAAVLREPTIVAIARSLLKRQPAPAAARRPLRLEDLAYTLQVGRDAMDERLAVVAGSLEDLESKLRSFVDGTTDGVADLFLGQVKQNKGLAAAFGADEELQEALEKWVQRGKFSKLLDLWTKGLAVDWEKLYSEAGPLPWKPRRISLPGYPFVAQRHWVKSRTTDPLAKREVKAALPLPPLVQDGIAALTGAEFFLADHRVQGRKVLPGVAYLEMMRVAASQVGTIVHPAGTIVRLKDVVWIKPAIVEEPRRLRVDLSPGPHEGSRCVISSDGEMHSEGTILCVEANQPRLDLAALRAQPGWKRVDAETCYRLFSSVGLDYGPAHRGIAELHVDVAQVLAKLVLPPTVAGTLDLYPLHPSLLDSALQASIGFALATVAGDRPAKLALPFAVEAVDVFGPCTAVMWALVRRPSHSPPNDRLQKLDIDLCDENGRVRVRIAGFSSRLLAGPPVASPAPVQAEPVDLKSQAVTWFKELLAKELGFPIDEIGEDEALDSYGIDSRMAMELTRALEKPFGEVSKTLFFEHHTLAELVDYFLEAHRSQLVALLGRVAPLPAPAPAAPPSRPPSKPTMSPSSRERPGPGVLDIAIVGLSGRYPQSPDIEAFWRNLRDGKDCITEVPADRWDWRAYYSEDRNEADRHYCKWGGFIADADKFDPLFFNISPGAAEYIDPQERIFLEHAWMAMEDAGYRREDLHRPSGGATDDELPGQVGVYAGVMYGEYQLLGLEARLKGQGAALASFYASVANRVSHALNLHGPSMAVDTMCSSSLTAIHLACQDLRLGRTDFALAGGVNLNLHPNKYSLLSQGQYISSNGRCESFGAGGDGYVPSEGVGVVMLKRLADAERDGDHIYGVIKSSALNHGGRTNGYSVPNPKAQQAVIGRALRESGVDPCAIGYIEAHGTGTRLGDPIEITGLAKALGGQDAAGGSCWIGSSKSNIGHCEAAAGIAGLTKILLQMREGEIAPSLHAETLNPNIDFATTPFQVNRQLREWSRPTVDGRLLPRAAGVSSFGAGGANAHLIIEEYVGAPARQRREPVVARPCLVVLSAKSEEQLRQCAGRLRELVESKDAPPLRDIAYTLQVGREAMSQRLAFAASSLQEMAGKLACYLRGDHAGLLAGRAKAGGVAAGGDPLAAWIKGAEIDWLDQYDEDDRPARVSLPTYPFARERYWALSAESAPPVARAALAVPTPVAEKALMLRPMWCEQAISADSSTEYSEHLVLSATPLPEVAGATVVRLSSTFVDRAVQLFEQIKTILQRRPRAPVLVQVVVATEDRLDAGLAALLKTARMENPQLVGQLIELDAANRSDVAALLGANGRAPADPHVRYRQGRREVMGWAELEDGPSPTLPIWRQGGTYLIVGGAGGLGLHFAREIARQVSDVTLILTGRSPLDGKRLADVEALKAFGARVEYRAVDVADGAAVQTLVDTIGGALNGIVHSAGVLRDSYILKKTATDFREVLASKVLGAVNLDAATARLDLDFFILFSSLAGAVGNPGQADYATANAFLDAFAADRTRRGGSGRTLSIDWPLWQDGGMSLDAQSRELMWQRTGLKPLQTGTGIDAFYRALHSGADQVVVLQGDALRLRQMFLSPSIVAPEETPTTVAEGNGELAAKVQGMLVEMLVAMLKIPVHRIAIDVPLEEYGIDSVAMMKLGSDLEKILGPLPKTLFYEHPSVEAASSFIAETCRPQLAKLFDVAPPAPPKAAPVPKAPIVEAPVAAVDSQDIAVIGMSGRFPMARDVDEFWQNLVQGRDCITEVPAERWDHSLYFDPDKDKVGKTYCKWGGFLDDVGGFDARFFRISPSEAELLDPQERLFLEASWTLLESSGYLGETLQRLCQSKVGVFVGSMSQQYHAVESDPVREAVVVLSSPSSIANRVSYFFNFQGPSIAIDTMCSSALNAVHMACDSLRRGDCKAAIAGGVNLTIHPKKYVGLSVGQMVGSHPGCTSFGDGDGYLPAEAVGAVLLKPLRDAIADGDEILAVIKSTAVNHGGQSSGYRVPSAAAQTELIAGNFARAGIDPRSVSYVESAANGSAMGDAIELRALAAAFARSTGDRQFCAIGSVKSNIGHAEAASGVTQLIKVLLQLRHRQLVPTIKAQPLNPNIAFEETPFRLQRTLEEWRRPDGGKRRASVSSFGAGGSNAHLIVEEYEGERAAAGPVDGRQLIALSAKTRPQLDAVARRLLAFVEDRPDLAVADIAYTLQTGRESMEHRLAFVVESREQLIEALRGGPGTPKLFTGDATEDNSDIRQLLSGKTGRTMLDMLLAERDLEKLALYWTKGVKILWRPMHAGQDPRRLALPTYPFERQSHWLAAAGRSAAAAFVPDSGQPLEDNVRRYVAHALGELLGVSIGSVDPAGTLQDHGVESIAATKLRRGLEQTFGVKLSARDMLTCPDVSALVRLVAERQMAPLSEGQKGLWLLHQLAPGTSAYNVPMALRFAAGLDVELLRRACAHVLRGFPILASVFGQKNGEPFQRAEIDPQLAFEHERIETIDEAAVVELLRARSKRPFDLEQGPLLRVHAISLADGTSHVLLVVHHIVFDGSSAVVLARALDETYRALLAGDAPSVAAEATDHGEFVRWQQRFLAGEAGQAQLGYWRRQLDGDLPVLALPADLPRPARRSFEGASHKATIGVELSREIATLARSLRINPSVVFLGAYTLLLNRYAGDDDLLVGMPVSGRPEDRFEETVGYFVNMLCIRSRIAGTQPVSGFLKELQLTVADAMDNGDYPFPALLKALKIDRDPARSPLFQAVFAYQNFVQPGEAGGLGIAQEGGQDLALEIYQGVDSFSLRMDYDVELFRPATIVRAMAHYIRLLESMVSRPDAAVADLSLTSPQERQQLLAGGQSADAPYDPSHGIVELFQQQARLTPDDAALAFEGRSLSYRELDEQSTRLAGELGEGGGLIGVCLPQGFEMILAMLAIWKAGAVYVPIASAWPSQRRRRAIEDSGMRALIGEAGLERFASTRIAPRDAAYVIYTSGSTGAPKGVVISHRSIAHHCQTMRDHHRLGPQDKVLQFASMSFDASLEQVLPALLSGATVVLRPDRLWSAAEFRREVAGLGLTAIDVSPSYLHELLLDTGRADGWAALASLRIVTIGGEALMPETLVLWRASPLSGRCRLVNAYGPTETTVTSLVCDLADEVSIGRPLPGERAHVLDAYGQPCPVGVVGELHIGGVGLALCYLDQPELTRQKFIDDPLAPGARLYRTGDRARLREDGAIDFLGRLDQQVKVRGFRVECGEVEAALRRLDSVAEAVVLLREDRLVAFVTPEVEGDLKGALAETLPDYMIPTTILSLPELPLTPGGKVDRTILRQLDPAATTAGVVEPRTGTERRLREIWRQVLAVDRIGIHDNFFDLGGHSLLAVRLMSLVQEQFGGKLPLSSLFEAPDIARQAALLDRGGDVWSPLVCLQPKGAKPPLFCVHAVAGDLLAYSALARHLGEARPFYGLQAPGIAGGAHPGTIEGLATLYLDAIRRVQPAGPYRLAGWSMGGLIAYEMARQLRQAGERVASLALIDSYTPDAVRDLVPTGDALLQANAQAMNRYALGRYEGEARLFAAGPADGGWAKAVSGAFGIVAIPGDHESLLVEPNVQNLARNLNRYLDEQTD